MKRKSKGTRYFFNPIFSEWTPIIAAGDLSIEGWYQLFRRCGYCTATVKR